MGISCEYRPKIPIYVLTLLWMHKINTFLRVLTMVIFEEQVVVSVMLFPRQFMGLYILYWPVIRLD